jgi:hypothetical protein
MCIDCTPQHSDHHDNLVTCTEVLIDFLMDQVYNILTGRQEVLANLVKEIEQMRKMPKIDLETLMAFVEKLKAIEKELLLGGNEIEITNLLLKFPKQNPVQQVAQS